jgi:hypothetical protein
MNNVVHYDKSDFADMVSIAAKEMGLREAIIGECKIKCVSYR